MPSPELPKKTTLFKRCLKQSIQELIPSKYRPIIVASMGRSGSTIVFRSVREGLAEQRFGTYRSLAQRLISDSLWDPRAKEITSGVVYKTHALSEELPLNCNAKIIFVFGKASDAALSVISCKHRYGDDWIKDHFEHLRAKGGYEDIPRKDILRFEEQILGWWNRDDVDRLFIKYEALWDHQEDLSRFCGFNVTLPPRKSRSGTGSHDREVIRQVETTYKNLDERIESMPNLKILKSKR